MITIAIILKYPSICCAKMMTPQPFFVLTSGHVGIQTPTLRRKCVHLKGHGFRFHNSSSTNPIPVLFPLFESPPTRLAVTASFPNLDSQRCPSQSSDGTDMDRNMGFGNWEKDRKTGSLRTESLRTQKLTSPTRTSRHQWILKFLPHHSFSIPRTAAGLLSSSLQTTILLSPPVSFLPLHLTSHKSCWRCHNHGANPKGVGWHSRLTEKRSLLIFPASFPSVQ